MVLVRFNDLISTTYNVFFFSISVPLFKCDSNINKIKYNTNYYKTNKCDVYTALLSMCTLSIINYTQTQSLKQNHETIK